MGPRHQQARAPAGRDDARDAPAPAADAAPQRQAPVDETGPMYLDEVEGTDAPAPDGGSMRR